MACSPKSSGEVQEQKLEAPIHSLPIKGKLEAALARVNCGIPCYLDENFSGVKPKHSSDEVLQRRRNLCSVVKNPKRMFRFTDNLSKRVKAAAMRLTNQVKLRINLFR